MLWERLVRPVMFGMDAERAHELGIEAMRRGLASFVAPQADAAVGGLAVSRFGLQFQNPLGLAAGFDKNAVVVNQLASLGYGFVEVGTVTMLPQPGNPKPRLFRLPADKALINRLGFNNDGAVAIANRLKGINRNCIIGVNIGRNKDVRNEEATENYLQCFDVVHPVADYITVNVSSPNTPGLRDLQNSRNLESLLSAIQDRNRELGAKRLLVKIAPDLPESDIEEIVGLCLDLEVSGIIATNTTISRDGLRSPDIAAVGAGGLSGAPLTRRSTEVISTIYRHAKRKMPIIGVGGIFTAQDAFDKIAAGASLLQAYTGFVYGGPTFAADVNKELAVILKSRGFANLDAAVGSGLTGQ